MTMTNATKPASTVKIPGTPPRFVNRALTLALRTPGLRRIAGKDFAILTVTGARTGTRYSTPVQYVYDCDHYLVLSQRHRRWWRNIATNPMVDLVVKGKQLRLPARIADESETADLVQRVVSFDHRIGRFYGIGHGPDGEAERAPCDELAEHMVALVIGERDQTT